MASTAVPLPQQSLSHSSTFTRHMSFPVEADRVSVKFLLSKSEQELREFCAQENINLPENGHTAKEALFYAAVSSLSSRGLLLEDVWSTASSDCQARAVLMTDAELRTLDAVEFTQQVDDGCNRHLWKDADLLILGVSRSGKSPLSAYLSHQGYLVANYPLTCVQGQLMDPPEEVEAFEADRVVGLFVDPDVLMSMRKKRAQALGIIESKGEYTDYEQIQEEIRWAKHLYSQHPDWLVVNVTHRGVEETAGKILDIMSERHSDRFKRREA